MARSYSISALRADLYRLLDRVLATGEPIEIERRGERLRIVATRRESRLDRLKPADGYLVDDADSIVHLDWSDEWRG